MKLLVLLVASFALAVNADVIDNIKAQVNQFKAALESVSAKVQKGENAKDAVKGTVNPVTIAELDVFARLCRPEEHKKSKRSVKGQLEKACDYMNDNSAQMQETYKKMPQAAKDAFEQYTSEQSTEIYLLKLEALVRWEEFVNHPGDFEKFTEKAKTKLGELKLEAMSQWDKFAAAAKAKFLSLKQEAGDKWDKLAQKVDKLKDAAKLNWEVLKAQGKEGWEQFKSDAKIGWERFQADIKEFKEEAKSGFEKFKDSAKSAWERFKEGVKETAEKVKNKFEEFGHDVKDVAGKAADNIEETFRKIKHKIASSSSGSFEIEQFAKNGQNMKVQIHSFFNQPKPVEKPEDKPADKPVEKPEDKPADKPVEQPAVQPEVPSQPQPEVQPQPEIKPQF